MDTTQLVGGGERVCSHDSPVTADPYEGYRKVVRTSRGPTPHTQVPLRLTSDIGRVHSSQLRSHHHHHHHQHLRFIIYSDVLSFALMPFSYPRIPPRTPHCMSLLWILRCLSAVTVHILLLIFDDLARSEEDCTVPVPVLESDLSLRSPSDFY